MRNLLLLLILLNVLLFGWYNWVEQPKIDDGVVVRQLSELQPRAELAGPIEVPVAQCFVIGGFAAENETEALIAALTSAGAQARVEPETRSVLVGHWVQVVDFEALAAARATQTQLREGGVEEAVIAGNDQEGYVISLGLFSELGRARAVEAQAIAAGVTPVILERNRDEPGFRIWLSTMDAPTIEPLLADLDAVEPTECAADGIDDEPEDEAPEAADAATG